MTNFMRNPHITYRLAVEAFRGLMAADPDATSAARAFAEAVRTQEKTGISPLGAWREETRRFL